MTVNDPAAIAARIPVIVPGRLFCVEKETVVGVLPVALEPVYAIPFPVRVMATLLERSPDAILEI